MPLQIPHPKTPLHLYRHLLREASYLPPLCRPWIASRIQDRYRDCALKTDAKPYVQEAHHYLRYLRSANAGHVARVLHLCYLATGRVGKRRRQLARLFLSHAPPADTDSLDDGTSSTGSQGIFPPRPDAVATTSTSTSRSRQETPERVGGAREPDWLDNWAMDKIQIVAASQVAQQGGDWPHTMRKSHDPKRGIPTENAFGRPFPKKVARNKLKRHYASILHQLLPPLPQGEWDQLKALANGETNTPGDMRMSPRRTIAQPVLGGGTGNEGSKDQNWDWMQYVTKPVRMIERKNSRKMKSLTSALDQDPRGQSRPVGVRTLGSRTLRRAIYGRLFAISPAMAQNPKSGKWVVKWGSHDLKVSKPTAAHDLQFFEGVDKNGKIPKTKPTQTPT